MTYEYILYEQRGSVGIVTLNRPDKLNAWSLPMLKEIRRAIDAAVLDAAIGAIVLTGAGRAYCAGADMSSFRKRSSDGDNEQRSGEDEAHYHYVGPNNWTSYVQQLPKPTIAAVNGTAVGVGVSHILPLDIRIASEKARFGLFFVKLGLAPELASSALLPRLVGAGRALEWCLTGRQVPAQEAKDAGLVSEVVAPEALLDRAVELGEQLADNPGPSMVTIRELLRRDALETEIEAVLRREGAALNSLYKTPEHKEAITAFFEKRKPVFRR